MNKILGSALLCVLLTAGPVLSLEITALAPSRGAPGTLVVVSGGPFTQQAQTFLGEQPIDPRIIMDNQIEFTLPPLSPGLYGLTVQDNSTVATQAYTFEVLAPSPQITTIDPRVLMVCPIDAEKKVRISGRNFLPGASCLLDGTPVPSRVISATALEAQLTGPRQPGVYGLSVRNPDGATSLPHSLAVNGTPKIINVERGADFVNSYEVIIRGSNFRFDSILVVKEPDERTFGETYQQLSFVAKHRAPSQGGEDLLTRQRNHLVYVDCQTLIYRRHPSTFQDKELGFKVFNSDGRNTEWIFVALP